ncbi:MAG: von Willebrand factor type A domain-containing protein [Proteobacteria bacterium]|nr:von Willebrand factor type A domain-containing protein [Pseudomonadota bacterium]
MSRRIRIIALLGTISLCAMGCVKDINAPSQSPTEPTVQDQPVAQTDNNTEPEIALPAPELDENGNPNTVVVAPQVVPPTPPEVPPAPVFEQDKWDVVLPRVELVSDNKDEQDNETKEKLKKALKNIDEGNLDFLSAGNDYDGRRPSAPAIMYNIESTSNAAGGAPAEMRRADAAPRAKAHKPAARKSAPAMLIDAEPAAMPAPTRSPHPVIIGADMPNIEMNTDEYSQYDPHRFINTAANPLSTFGADVDTASYGVFRRYINEGRVPRNLDLRTEEMINYFKYDYPNPKADEPFSVTTEISSCPWNKDTKLFLVGAKTKDLNESERPASNIVFLLDISGSMRGRDRLNLIKAGIITMLPKLTAQDKVSIVTYSGRERFIIDGVPGDHHKTILKALDMFDASGSTNGEAGIQMAYAVAKKNFIPGGNNRIIMGTDGDLNVGISSTNELKSLIEKKREMGIFLSVLGVGSGNYKDNRLEALADYGNGNYNYIDTIREAKRVLVDEFTSTVFVAAKDVKFQIDFNPSKIKGYRQIGYETRKLNAEDFADDKKDGGEVGAGHQVTVLYEIVETGSSVDVPEPSSKYQKVENVQSNEYATVKLRYKKPDGNTSTELSWPVTSAAVTQKMSANMNFASAVAGTAMILNNSTFKGNLTYDKILEQLKDISSLDKDEYRAEFVALVRRLKGL